MSNVDDLKAAIRERDGNRCNRCGMTADEHVAEHSRTLHVHREQPETEYTMEGCLTLCVDCHWERHRELKESGIIFKIKPDYAALKASRCNDRGSNDRSKPNATPITSIRFTEAELAIIETIRVYHDLPTIAATLRMLGVAEFKRLNPKPAPKRKPAP